MEVSGAFPGENAIAATLKRSNRRPLGDTRWTESYIVRYDWTDVIKYNLYDSVYIIQSAAAVPQTISTFLLIAVKTDNTPEKPTRV